MTCCARLSKVEEEEEEVEVEGPVDVPTSLVVVAVVNAKNKSLKFEKTSSQIENNFEISKNKL